MKSLLLVSSDAPGLLQATSFAFLAAVISLPSERCANKKQAQVEFFPKYAEEIYASELDCLNFSSMFKY